MSFIFLTLSPQRRVKSWQIPDINTTPLNLLLLLYHTFLISQSFLSFIPVLLTFFVFFVTFSFPFSLTDACMNMLNFHALSILVYLLYFQLYSLQSCFPFSFTVSMVVYAVSQTKTDFVWDQSVTLRVGMFVTFMTYIQLVSERGQASGLVTQIHRKWLWRNNISTSALSVLQFVFSAIWNRSIQRLQTSNGIRRCIISVYIPVLYIVMVRCR